MQIIDSLQQELVSAKHDTDRVKLRYRIGIERGIMRTGYWDSVLTSARLARMYVYECWSLDLLGRIHYEQLHNLNKSAELLESSIKIAEKNSNKQEMLLPLFILAIENTHSYNTKKSLDYSFRGLKIAEDLQNKLFMARFTYQIASNYIATGELKKALPMEFKAFHNFSELKKPEEASGVLLDIGSIYEQLKDEKNTIKYYLACEKYAIALGESPFAGELYIAVGAAYNLKKQPDKAKGYFLKSYHIFKSLGMHRGVASVLLQLADNSFLKGDLKSAKSQALEGLELARSINMISQIPSLANLLKKIYSAEKNYEKALEYYELLMNTKDSASNEKNRKEALEKQFAYDFEKKENENKLLAQQNQIQSLKLSQNNYLIAGLGVAILFILTVSLLFVRQNKFRSAQQSMQLEQKLLRSQMNPHFIFNSLQAIQNFILKQEGKEAAKYLSSFAYITRSVLESSRMDYIPFNKEITLLENYLQLQKLRFGNRFDYTIHISNDADTEQISIPPMLSQPFIENAVEHGMQGIEEGGKIDIYYTVKENYLHIDITDNGWGMKQENDPGKQHQSMAMEITRERIELMNKKAKQKTVFSISEAFPSEPSRIGVKVTFRLPVQLINGISA